MPLVNKQNSAWEISMFAGKRKVSDDERHRLRFFTKRRRRNLCASLAALAALFSAPALAKTPEENLKPSGTFSVAHSPSAQTPPMGWNPWNAFRTDVDEEKIRGSAQALVDTGLAARGYRYVNIDDGWALRRLSDGFIRIRDSMFPSSRIAGNPTGSFVPFTSFIHGLGLKAGLYTDIGRNTCAQRWDAESPNLPVGTVEEREVGSFGHAAQDMRTAFRDWHFDYIKIDACGVADYTQDLDHVSTGKYRPFPSYIVRGDIPSSDPKAVEALYAALNKDIRRWGGKDAILSICTWGEALSSRWGNKHGNLWRTSPDIEFTWDSMLVNIDSAADLALYAGPGRWNDPDMLVVGHNGFDEHHITEARAHMSMWAIMAAPLLLGYDLRSSPQSLIDVVGDPEVIAIDQDPAGNQGVSFRSGETMTVVKTLTGLGQRAVALFNRSAVPAKAGVDWRQLGFAPGTSARVRDVWQKRDVAPATDKITVTLKPHEAMLLRMSGTPINPSAIFLDEMPARVNVAVDGLDRVTALPQGWVPARIAAAPDGSPLQMGATRFDKGIGLFANSRLEVRTDKAFDSFSATPAILSGSGPVRFSVYADRRLVKEILVVPGAKADQLFAKVAKATVVELVATAAESAGHPAMIAWADATLKR
jgi:hypothetical protein